VLSLVLLPLGGTLQWLLLGGLQLALTLLSWYGALVEPFWIQHTELTVSMRNLRRPIFLLLLTDLHMERMTVREEAALAAIAGRKPDLILLGGDLLNLSYVGDPTAIDEARSFLARLHEAPAGTYFVRGTVDVDPPEVVRRVLEGLPITVLDDEVVSIEHAGATIQLVGLPADRPHDELVRRLGELPARSPSICLHHTPDLVEEASRHEIDLYLAGHTHGGQICLPLVGPLATASRFGRRYVRGRHQLDSTTAYVCRGLGLEGLGAPRVRFLARPELVWIELVPHPA
jgi:predicted MPP superfamily phosphohydrolase